MRYNIKCVGIHDKKEKGGVEVIGEHLTDKLADNKINSKPIIISFWPPLSVILIIKNLFRRKKIICYEHFDFDYIPWKWRIMRKIFYRFAHKVVCISMKQHDSISKHVSSKKLAYIPNPVLKRSEFNKENKKNNILYVGHLRGVKQVHLLINAFNQLKKDSLFTNWSLSIVGSGEDENKLKDLAYNCQSSQSITFYGFQSDLTSFYDEGSIFVLPSKSEGVPLVILEAMRAGCVVVTSKYSKSVRELVEPFKTGFIYDDIDDLRNLLYFLMRSLNKDPDIFNNIRNNALSFSNQFSSESFLKKWREVLND